MHPSRRKMRENNLCSMVMKEIGQERWTTLLRNLAEVEEKTGGLLRLQPRGADRQQKKDDETCPLLLFAPDRDRDGREFASVAGTDLLYVDRNCEKNIPYS